MARQAVWRRALTPRTRCWCPAAACLAATIATSGVARSAQPGRPAPQVGPAEPAPQARGSALPQPEARTPLVGRTPSGASGRDARQEAIRSIPWATLSPSQRSAVSAVVRDATIYRRMPTRVADCDAEMFDLLLDRPELVVEVWGLLGISKLTLERIGPDHYKAVDGAGAEGDVRVIHREGGPNDTMRALVLAHGDYSAPPMPAALTASCVLWLSATPTTEANGRTYIVTDLDSFLRLDQRAVDLVARTLEPLVARTADHNFTETVRFVSLFSHSAERNPQGMQRLSERLTSVDAETRAEFVAVCQRVAQRSDRRMAAPRLAVTPASATLRAD